MEGGSNFAVLARMMAEDRVWSAETRRVRGTDALGPLWRAMVVRGSGRSSSVPARRLADLLGSIGTDVEIRGADTPGAVRGGVDLVCAVGPQRPSAAERVAFALDAPFLSLATVPDREDLVRLIEHLRVRREPALEWRVTDTLGFAIGRLDVEARDALTIDLDPAALEPHHGHRAVIEPGTHSRERSTRSTLQVTMDPAGPAVRASASSLRVHGRDIVVAVDATQVVSANDAFCVQVHPRSRLVCC